MHFPASNNALKYEALLHSLRIATALGIHRLRVLGDYLLVINQGNKKWLCLGNKMMMNCQELRKLENNFNGLEYLHILQGHNEVTDELVKLSSSQAMVPLGVLMQKLRELSIGKALSKSDKADESSQETTPPVESLSTRAGVCRS
jgi:ribonuclease HI